MQTGWYAVQVRGRFEKSVSDSLQNRGYNVFFPMYVATRQWSDRVKQISLPLFPNYTFCRLDIANRLPLLTTPGVISIVGIGRVPTPVDPDEIEAIRTAVASGSSVVPWPRREPGQRVRIESGPLRGLSGVVLKSKGPRRLVVGVTLLQRSVAVDLDEGWLVPHGREPSEDHRELKVPSGGEARMY